MNKGEAAWYRLPLRIAALQCNFEDDALAVPRIWREHGFDTEQLLHAVGRGYYGFFDEARDGAMLTKYLEICREIGTRVILYLNVHALPPDPGGGARPDWQQINRHGEPAVIYGAYGMSCFNTSFRDLVFETIAGAAAHEIDGVFLDGPIFGRDCCYCSACRVLFTDRTGLRMPEPRGPWADETGFLAFRRFRVESLTRFVAECRRVLKHLRPGAPIYMNNAGPGPERTGQVAAELLPHVDMIGVEGGFQFYGSPKQVPLHKTSLAAKYAEAVARGKPTVVFIAGDHKPWSRLMHTAAETRLAYAHTIASGASPWYGLHAPIATLETPGGRAAGEMNRLIERATPALTGTRSCARVAVMYSQTTADSYAAEAAETDFTAGERSGRAKHMGDSSAALQGAYECLSRGHIPFDIIVEDGLPEDMNSRFDCVVLPTCACMREGTAEALRSFVEAGGALVVGFDTGLYDERGERRREFLLADVTGVSFAGGFTRYDAGYVTIDAGSEALSDLAPSIQAGPRVGVDVEAREGTEVLARFHLPMKSRYMPLSDLGRPAILRRGKVVSLCGTYFEDLIFYELGGWRRMISRLVEENSTPPVAFDGLPETVEVTVRDTSSGSRVLHLVNSSGEMTRPIERVFPVAGARARLAVPFVPARAHAHVAGRDLEPLRYNAGRASFEIPAFGEYEMIELGP